MKWLESSDKFWGNFNVCSPTLKKKTKNEWHYLITIAVNSLKKILKNIKIKTINKKHKGMKVTLRESCLYENIILMLKNQKLWYKKHFKLKILKWKLLEITERNLLDNMISIIFWMELFPFFMNTQIERDTKIQKRIERKNSSDYLALKIWLTKEWSHCSI